MTDNTANKGEADAGTKSAVIDLGSPDEQADLTEEPTDPSEELTDPQEEPTDPEEESAEIEDDDSDTGSALSTGAVTGGFGLAGVALAIVSLTTNWTSQVVVSHAQYRQEVNAPSPGLTTQQQLNMYVNGWHTQGWWAFVFAAVAVLLGAGALLSPSLLGSDRTPGWAKAAATSAIIVGLVGVLLAVLTITGVFGAHLTAPAASTG